MYPSARAQFITRRTYNRPLDEKGNRFETWDETVDRAIGHQKWLWERALGRTLAEKELLELEELRSLMLTRKASLAGRTLWLGGTEVAMKREASQFNCSFLTVKTVYDAVDAFWLLLQGCGVGFKPHTGSLTGFIQPLDLEIIRSDATSKTNEDSNIETYDSDTGTWVVRVGDAAEAWAKAIGKIMIHKYPAKKLVIDFRPIRPGGVRLKGYGWISSGDNAISVAFKSIVSILNRRAGSLLTKIDILDIVNWLGTTLSSRRSAEIALMDYGDPEWRTFALAKKDMYQKGLGHREQSNNSLIFWEKPSFSELKEIFDLITDAGGSEPGMINGVAARRRASWYEGGNPCVEILLADKSFCNLVETDLGKFIGDMAGLRRAIYIMARANYRQTCVDLRDGILQEAWHVNNAFLHLCGVGLTGIVRSDLTPHDYIQLQRVATHAAYGMAEELGQPYPKNVTTVKPSGTLSKIMDTTEGMHRPQARYIFNNINFSRHDPIVTVLAKAGYKITSHSTNSDSVLIAMPVDFGDVSFSKKTSSGIFLDDESAVSQLERYKMLMGTWCQQNVSCTIYYKPSEIAEITKWMDRNWNDYVGVAFQPRQDPTKTAKDLGYDYLPQEVVDKETYEEYVSGLSEVDLTSLSGFGDEEPTTDCAGGACPVR